MDSKINKVLKSIEKLEDKWQYILTDNEDAKKTFARTDKKNKIIRYWSVPRTTGSFLKFLVSATGAQKILELGCSAGYSAIWMASAFSSKKAQIYTTEILEPKIKIAKKNFKDSGLSKKITLIEKDIFEVIKNWKHGKIDLVFIDADKEDYFNYYESVFPLVKSGGIIIADNVGNFKDLMKKFIHRVETDKRIEYDFLDIDNGLMLIYKK